MNTKKVQGCSAETLCNGGGGDVVWRSWCELQNMTSELYGVGVFRGNSSGGYLRCDTGQVIRKFDVFYIVYG